MLRLSTRFEPGNLQGVRGKENGVEKWRANISSRRPLRNEMGEWNSRREKGAATTSDWSWCGTTDGFRESCAGGLLGRDGD